MSRERPASANLKKQAKQASPMPMKENLKTTNATNPTLHTQKQGQTGQKHDAANLGFGKTQGGKGQKTEQKTGKIGSTSSISFGPVRYDQNTRLLYTDATKGGDHIRCSITQDAFCECFETEGSLDAMQTSFKEHKGEITKALEQKWLAGKWKVPSKEICLEEMDLRRFLKE